jgi:two-component system OmpR family response regulator
MLPGQSGLDLCRELRTSSDVPIIMLTAMGQLADKVTGLELGADDYIVKPFEPRELLARARAAVRRHQPDTPASAGSRLVLDAMTVDTAMRSVTAPDGRPVSLTFAEFELLALLMNQANATLPRAQILQQVFGRSAGLYDRSVDVLLSRLRRKLSQAGVSLNIESVRSVGYMLVGQVTRC